MARRNSSKKGDTESEPNQEMDQNLKVFRSGRLNKNP